MINYRLKLAGRHNFASSKGISHMISEGQEKSIHFKFKRHAKQSTINRTRRTRSRNQNP